MSDTYMLAVVFAVMFVAGFLGMILCDVLIGGKIRKLRREHEEKTRKLRRTIDDLSLELSDSKKELQYERLINNILINCSDFIK